MIYIPKNGKTPEELQKLRQAHPFYTVVHDDSNLHKVDLEHHFEADKEKISKFLGTWKFNLWNDPETKQGYLESLHRGEPEALEKWLFRNYPWSRHPFYFDKQRNMNIRNNMLFQDAVKNCGSYFPEFYVEKCKRAAALARQHNQQLHCMPTPSLRFILDFGRFTPKVA